MVTKVEESSQSEVDDTAENERKGEEKPTEEANNNSNGSVENIANKDSDTKKENSGVIIVY